jgi:hypothetical protein
VKRAILTATDKPLIPPGPGLRVGASCHDGPVSDPEDDDHTTFFRLGGSEDDDERDDDAPVVSRAAFQLHGFAMVNSVRDGVPGFVSDDYLNAISAETSVTATELCMAGLWERNDERGGYVIHDPMVDEVVHFNQKMDDDKAFCEATGGHQTSEEFGPTICAKCHAPLGRIPGPDEADG